MRNLTVTSALFFLLIATNLFGQETGLARPERINGVPVYVMSDPIEKYEIVGQINTGLVQTLKAVGSESSAEALDVRELVRVLVVKAQRKARKGKVPPFDAIVTEDGDYGTLIKFVRVSE